MHPSASPAGGSPQTTLLSYWHLLVRRRWVMISAVTLLLTGVAIKTMRTTPTYRGVATLQIERIDPNIMKFQEVLSYDSSFLSYQDFYQTQYRLLQTRAVAQHAVHRLDLISEPEFLRSEPPGLMSRLWTGLTRSFSRRPAPSTAASEPDRLYIDAVLADLHIEPIKNTHLVSVAFVSPSPVLAAKVANGVAEAYISFGLEEKVGTSENAGDFLGRQVETLGKEVEALERQAQVYGESKEIIPTSGQGNTTVSALEDLQRAYTAAQADRAEKDATYTTIRKAPDTAVSQVTASPLIQDLTSQVAALERDNAELSKKFKPEWPALAQVSSKLEKARSRLAEETASLATSARQAAETAWRASVQHERNLAVLYANQKRVALKLSTDSIEYTNLRSEISKKRETLDQLMKRQSEIALTSHMRETRQSNIRIIDPARVPERVYRPNKKLNFLLGLFAGLGLGIGLALLIEHLDNSIKSADEIRALTGLTVIGMIPELRPSGPHPLRKDESPMTPGAQPDLITHHAPRSPLAEAYKELRTATLLASPDEPPRTILVTSCLPQEGKSQTSLNLAIALAQTGRRVLLVDTDLRRPRLHQALGLDNDTGVSTYLSGNAPVEPLIRETCIQNLCALTSGPIPPNPSELLGSRRFLSLAREFADAKRFDHLVFDSPPLLSVADPIIVATVLDGTILVVQSGVTPREALLRGAAKLSQAKVKVLGAVLNSMSDSHGGYYYYNYHSREQRQERRTRRADGSA